MAVHGLVHAHHAKQQHKKTKTILRPESCMYGGWRFMHRAVNHYEVQAYFIWCNFLVCRPFMVAHGSSCTTIMVVHGSLWVFTTELIHGDACLTMKESSWITTADHASPWVFTKKLIHHYDACLTIESLCTTIMHHHVSSCESSWSIMRLLFISLVYFLPDAHP